MARVQWKPVEKGIYARDYGSEKAYQLQSMSGGKRYTDTLGVMGIEDARIIRDTLARNRKLGAGPQTWLEMQSEEKEKQAAEKIQARNERQETIKQEIRKQTNTVSHLWENSFYPHRLTLKRSLKENAAMSGRWTNHVKPHFGEIPLEELSRKDFESFVAAKRASAKLSEMTIFKCLTDLRQAWAWGMEEGFVERSFPGRSVIREVSGELDSEKKCYLEPEEARLLLQTVYERRMESRNDHDVYCFVVLGLGLGLRAGDICKLTRQSVERHIIDRTKNKRSRFVHFNFAPVKAMLDERLALYPPDSPTDLLFVTQQNGMEPHKRPGVPVKFYALIKELRFNDAPKRKGHRLEKIDFHALRHTFATLAAMRGVDHLTLMRLMGHKTASMTLRYIEIADAHQAKHQEKAMAGIFPKELEGTSFPVE